LCFDWEFKGFTTGDTGGSLEFTGEIWDLFNVDLFDGIQLELITAGVDYRRVAGYLLVVAKAEKRSRIQQPRTWAASFWRLQSSKVERDTLKGNHERSYL
jgi:hypothetical protein